VAHYVTLLQMSSVYFCCQLLHPIAIAELGTYVRSCIASETVGRTNSLRYKKRRTAEVAVESGEFPPKKKKMTEDARVSMEMETRKVSRIYDEEKPGKQQPAKRRDARARTSLKSIPLGMYLLPWQKEFLWKPQLQPCLPNIQGFMVNFKTR